MTKKKSYKPDSEEMKSNIDDVIAEEEKIQNPEPEKEPEDPEKTPEDEPEKEPEKEPESDPEPEKEPESDPEPEKEPEGGDDKDVDYKKKYNDLMSRYKGSSQEGQILHAKTKKLVDSVEQAAEMLEVTDKQLKSEYSDYESMSEFEQKMAKDNLLNKMKFDLVHEAVRGIKNVDAWVKKVDDFVEDPKVATKHPDLSGREDEFRAFAMKQSRRGVDFDILISAFLHDVRPAKKKGKLLETGSSGGASKKPSDKVSVEDGAKMRKGSYRTYRDQLLKKKKIDISV